MSKQWLITLLCLTPLVAVLLAFLAIVSPLILVYALYQAYLEASRKKRKTVSVDLAKQGRATYEKLFNSTASGPDGFMAVIQKLKNPGK